MRKYVIIGNGAAAAGCIEGIRAVDKAGSITVVSGENHPVYCRPLISYLLEGKTDEKRIKYRPDSFYEDNGCDVIYGKRALSVNAENKTVTLDGGEALDYDSLCVCTGSSPFVPPTDGLDSVRNKHAFMTLDDALALEKAVTADSRVLIIGAGLIGLKCAEGIRDNVKSVTVCDLAPRVLSSILDGECAEAVRKHLESNGLSFILGDSVARFEANTAYMKSGKEVAFDVLVTAVGVRPNVSLIKDIGGACGRAITVDSAMKTSVTDIYAAGDCTESVDASSGTVKIMALMPNAYMQGHCAGVNMAGGFETFDDAIPMNSAGFFGLHIMTAGSHAENCEVYEEKRGNTVKKLFVSDGRLTGFILVGGTERAGIYTSLIRSRTRTDSVDFGSLIKSPALSAFDINYRKKILGGVV